MDFKDIRRLNTMKAKEAVSGPFIWTPEEMDEFERLNVAHFVFMQAVKTGLRESILNAMDDFTREDHE